MLYSGLNYRKIQKRDIFSFKGVFSLNETSGSGLFGFSGENQTFDFKFISGKIIDPESRYVFSYQKNKGVSISGNVSGSFYDYYINDILFCKSGIKNNFNIENFYLNTTSGLVFDSSVYTSVKEDGDFVISGLSSIFYSGKPFSGKIVETGVGGDFDIFSGEVSSFDFQSGYQDIKIINLPISVKGTGVIIFSGNVEIPTEKEFVFSADFQTSLGKRNKGFTITGKKSDAKTAFNFMSIDEESFVDGDNLPTTRDLCFIYNQYEYNITKTGKYTFSQSESVDSVSKTGLPFYVELKSDLKDTGCIENALTGCVVLDGGSGYFANALAWMVGVDWPTTTASVCAPPFFGTTYRTEGRSKTAEIVALASNGVINGFKIIFPGANYIWPPLANPAAPPIYPRIEVIPCIKDIIITNPGNGYFSNPNFYADITEAEEGVSDPPPQRGASGFFTIDEEKGTILNAAFYEDFCFGITRGGFSPGHQQGNAIVSIGSVLSGFIVVSGGSGYTGSVDIIVTETGGGVYGGGAGGGAAGSGLIDFRVYGVNLISSGSGYTSQPSLVFKGKELNKASGIAYVNNGFVTGVEITNQGLYSSVPGVSFLGGSPQISAAGKALTTGRITGTLIMSRGGNYSAHIPITTIITNSGSEGVIRGILSQGAQAQLVFSSVALGSGIFGTYDKTFLNSFNLFTGKSEDSMTDFNENNYTGDSGYCYQNDVVYLDSDDQININVTYKSHFDNIPMVAKLVVSGYGGQTGSLLITGTTLITDALRQKANFRLY